MKLLSICIPNFNRIEKLAILISKITSDIKKNRLEDKVELCISDDCSVEDPTSFINRKQLEYPNITILYRRNNSNKGMDYNFLNSVLISSGKYCWIIGNDDVPADNGIVNLINILERVSQQNIDIIVTPFSCYDYNNNYVNSIYPLGTDIKEEFLFSTSVSSDFNNLIKLVHHDSAIFGFLSNVVFKREQWIKHGNMFEDKMDKIFIQMYMNIQTLVEGANYLYIPIKIICNYLDDVTNQTIDRRYHMAVGLYDVITHFFKGEDCVRLQRILVDQYISADFWELPENNSMRKDVIQIPSIKNDLYSQYFVSVDKRSDKFSKKKVIIYGAGKYGNKALKKLKEYNSIILGFCDADESKYGTYIEKYPIFNFQQLLMYYAVEDCIVIVANNKSMAAIINKLVLNDISNIALLT